MIDSAKGINNDPVKSIREERKCISNETTLERDFTNKNEILVVLREISINLAKILRKENKYCNVVEVHLKDNMFRSFSHQKKLSNATNLSNEIFNVSKQLLDEMYNDEPIRLIGIRLDKLTSINNHQVSLFEEIENREKDVKLEKTIDSLQDRFGYNIIGSANKNNRDIKKKY
jgi:DNA polymerase-4